jgi:hypothetical protein
LKLNIEPDDVYYFDIYLRELLGKTPMNSLRSNGSETEKSKGYQLTYEIKFIEDSIETVFEIQLIFTQTEVKPIIINTPKYDSTEVKEALHELLISTINEAERKTIKKPMKKFEIEAHLSTGHYPIKSTIEFGKYRLSPIEERSEKGWLCKLRFQVEAINKQNSHTWATIEAKQIAAFLSVIFCKLIQLHKFSDVTEDLPSVINYDEIDRPDLRPVKHPFSGELMIPRDFLEIWDNFQSCSPKIRDAFISSCMCFQVAKEINVKYSGISYTIFVTAIEIISKQVIKRTRPTARFKEFICDNIGRSDDDFRGQLGRFYSDRSDVLHNVGIGMDFSPIDGIRSYQVVSGKDHWRLEIYVNAALIGFLKRK